MLSSHKGEWLFCRPAWLSPLPSRKPWRPGGLSFSDALLWTCGLQSNLQRLAPPLGKMQQAGGPRARLCCLLGHRTLISQVPKQCVFPLARLVGHVNVALCGAAEGSGVSTTPMRRAQIPQGTAEGREHEYEWQVLQLGRARREEGGLQKRDGNRNWLAFDKLMFLGPIR